MPLMSDLSSLPPRDMALCHCVLKEQHVTCLFLHFHPCDQRLAAALAASEGRTGEGWIICCPFLLLILFFFIPSLLPCARSSISHLLSMHCSACCSCLSNTTQRWQWHHFLWKVYQYTEQMVQQVEHIHSHTRRHTFAHAYFHIESCGLLGWPLNGFDTHYQLSLMWN